MLLFWLIVIVASSIWVYTDANKLGVRKDAKAGLLNLNYSPMRWLVSCLLLWIIFFPLYWIKRVEYKKLSQNSQSDKQ